VPEIPSPGQRVLDAALRKGVTLEIVTFDESTHTAADAAKAVGAEVGQIVKSLVFVADRDDGPEPYLVLVSGANHVDVSLLAAVLTEPRIRRATADEAREFTGFSIGGIPPFGYAHAIRTIMAPRSGPFREGLGGSWNGEHRISSHATDAARAGERGRRADRGVAEHADAAGR